MVVAINAPLLFEVTCPKNALNSASVMYVTAVAESEMKAAARRASRRQRSRCRWRSFPSTSWRPKRGFPSSCRATSGAMPRRCSRTGRSPGSCGSNWASAATRSPISCRGGEDGLALPVHRETDPTGMELPRRPRCGSPAADVVHLEYEDPQTHQNTQWKVRLLSDGRMELMDATFTAQCDTIHLGGKFCLRVVDPDRDRSDARDTVQVRGQGLPPATSLTLTLTETLPHSGVFETSFQPELHRREGARRKTAAVPAGHPAQQVGATSSTSPSATRSPSPTKILTASRRRAR